MTTLLACRSIRLRQALLAAVLSGALRGQPVAAAQTPLLALAAATRLRCEFSLLTTGTWDGEGRPTATQRLARLTLTFTSIDADTGSAEVTGAFGAPAIVAQRRGGYLHFMQIDTSGFLYTTTVFDRPNRLVRYPAVHSRHEFTDVALPGYTSRPQQYFGDCEPTA